jgi:glycosyltransferase involved in cell wall biosynthesis
MPVFDAEQFLQASLESLLAQDYEPYEIVVCDDGSTDRTPEILAAWPTVRTIRQENSGPSAARNAAIAASRGDLVAFFDADDLWPVNRLTLQATYLLDHPDDGCVLGRQEWIEPPPGLVRDPVYGDLGGIPLTGAMFRRAVLDEVGGFDPSFRRAEDRDLLVRVRERGFGIGILPEVILYRRFHGGNLIAEPTATHPLLRSLRQKLERDRVGQRSES